jgi:hypothetical protein
MCPRVRAALTVLTLLVCVPSAAWAGDRLTATAASTVQSGGPRPGAAGRTYFNVQGKANERFASFGVLDYRSAKPETPVTKVGKLTLTLTQSVARFSKDGAIRIAVAPDVTTDPKPEGSTLKFDPKAEGGVGEQLGKLIPLASAQASFTKRKTGDVDAIVLMPSAEAEAVLIRQINSGGVIRLVVTPADDAVAATYFGVGANEAEQRPNLALETTP